MSNFIENGVYGYKNNRLANGEFNRCQYVYKNGKFIKLEENADSLDEAYSLLSDVIDYIQDCLEG